MRLVIAFITVFLVLADKPERDGETGVVSVYTEGPMEDLLAIHNEDRSQREFIKFRKNMDDVEKKHGDMFSDMLDQQMKLTNKLENVMLRKEEDAYVSINSLHNHFMKSRYYMSEDY